MSFYDQERDSREIDAEEAQRAFDVLCFARECKYYPSLDPADHASPADREEWARANREIDRRIYFGLRLPR